MIVAVLVALVVISRAAPAAVGPSRAAQGVWSTRDVGMAIAMLSSDQWLRMKMLNSVAVVRVC